MIRERLARSFRSKVEEKDLWINNLDSSNINNLTNIRWRRINNIEDCNSLLEINKK